MNGTPTEVQIGQLRTAIDGGLTLPSDWYKDPSIFELDRDVLFGRTWQCVARVDQLAEHGDYVSAMIGNLPVVVVRDGSDIRAFVNVCRHRFHEVAVGEGNRKTLQCRYHAWTYALDGTLKSAPRSNREPEFDPCAFALKPLPVAEFGPLVLVNPDPQAAPFEETYGELQTLMESRGFDLSPLRFRSRDEFDLPCNWKVFIENSVECYHCPTAHPQFGKSYAVEPESYRLEEYEWFSAQTTHKLGDDEDQLSYQFYYMFPGLFFVPTAWTDEGALSFCRVFIITPIDAERTLMICDSYCLDTFDEATAVEYDRLGKAFMEQDRELVESVQRGIQSGVMNQGCLLLDSERLIQHFYRRIERALAAV